MAAVSRHQNARRVAKRRRLQSCLEGARLSQRHADPSQPAVRWRLRLWQEDAANTHCQRTRSQGQWLREAQRGMERPVARQSTCAALRRGRPPQLDLRGIGRRRTARRGRLHAGRDLQAQRRRPAGVARRCARPAARSSGQKDRRAVALELETRSHHGGGMKDQVIRISIALLDVDPAIWRRIEVPANYTLEGLHDVIQIVIGWADYHLHHFQFADVMYGVPSPEDRDMYDGRKIKLSTALVDGERVFQYLYDYGDGWCCVVVLEAIAPTVPGVVYPRLVEGARHGPPEDVGGPSGYGEFLEAIADPKHERHAELLEWCGGDFDPQQFNDDEINRRIASLAPRKNTRRKTTKPATG